MTAANLCYGQYFAIQGQSGASFKLAGLNSFLWTLAVMLTLPVNRVTHRTLNARARFISNISLNCKKIELCSATRDYKGFIADATEIRQLRSFKSFG